MFQAGTLWKAILNAKHWLWNMFGWTSHINVYFGKSVRNFLLTIIGIWKKNSINAYKVLIVYFN